MIEASSRPALRARGRLVALARSATEELAGGPAELAALAPPELRAALEPMYLATAWYDGDVLIALCELAARLRGVDVVEHARWAGELTARGDMESVYQHQLRARSVRDMAGRLPRIFGRYYDLPLTVLRVSDDELEVEIAGVPPRCQRIFRALNEGFMVAALCAAGAEDLRFHWATQPLPSGVLCRAHVRWRAAQYTESERT